MSFVYAALVSLSVLEMVNIAAAARMQVATGSEETSQWEDGNCECFKDLSCSSCSFSICPFEEHSVRGVQPLAGGGSSRVSGSSVAAWHILVAGGPGYVLKFGGPMETPVKAARLAHALGVRTPRILNTNAEHCPSLLKSGVDFPKEFSELLRRWESTNKVFSIQEWAQGIEPVYAEPLEVEESELLHTLWYEAGGVSVLDWLLGKSDLFNDVPLNFENSVTAFEDVQINLGNLIIDEDTCTAIDLNIDMSLTRWDLWQAVLQDLLKLGSDGDLFVLPWVQKVVVPMLSLVKSAGGTSTPVYPFGKFSAGTYLQGYEPFLSPMLIQLGMVDALKRATHLLGHTTKHDVVGDMPGKQALMEMPALVKSLDKIRSKLWDGVDAKFRALKEDYAKAQKLKLSRCCEVQCEMRVSRSFTNWNKYSTCTKQIEPVRVALREGEHSCEDVLNKRSTAQLNFVALKCLPKCGPDAKKGVRLAGLVDVDMSQCL